MATFGNTNTSQDEWMGLENIVVGSYFQMGGTDGTADSISARISCTTANKTARCLLFDSSSNLLANGETEEKTLLAEDDDVLYTFDFVGTKPTLTANAWYYICIWGESTNGIGYLRLRTEVGYSFWYDVIEYNGAPDPATFVEFEGYESCIYCTYTEEGVEHTHSASDTMTISDSVAAAATYNVALADTFTLSDNLVAELIEGVVVVRRKGGRPYGLRPARVAKIGRIGL